ncbi:MAG: hypothetical protein KAJ12_07175 [Bacteroidetes bacterium]|nr:hypothetical protein [Bacteroidota bacterium]
MKTKLQLLIIVVAIGLAFVIGRGTSADAQETPNPQVAWEYMDGANLTIEQLNQLGAQGWEISALTVYSRDLYYVLKRLR